MSEYKSADKDSQRAKNEYTNMIHSIERRMDPDSNTVIVVDDEKGIRRFVSRSIRKTAPNVVVYEAENGQAGLDILEEIRENSGKDPIFIVTDLNMPVMDGWQLIDALYKDYKSQGRSAGIPVIVLSSTSGEKGIAFLKKSVHGRKSRYEPLVAIAKEACTDASRYASQGEKGLVAWIQQFSKYA